MSSGLLLLVAAIYFGVTVNEAWRGNYPDALIFGSYALSVVGFIWKFIVS